MSFESRVLISTILVMMARSSIAAVPPTTSAPPVTISAKTVSATLPSATAYEFTSKINRANYRLTVLLPSDYQTTDKRYPVFYLMDGDQMAILADYILPPMFTMGDIPKIILVGVGYPGETERAVDYSPFPRSKTYKGWKVPANRGADNFLRVMNEEIIPLIDEKYRTDPSDRGFGGHSLGGLLTTYTLFHASDTFKRFWISSPPLFHDDGAIFQDEAYYAASHKDLPVRVFADVGSDEMPIMLDYLAEMRKMVAARNWKSLVWKQEMPVNQIHATTPSTVVADAFKFLYGDRPAIQVDGAHLQSLVGKYRLPKGHVLDVTTDGHDLFVFGEYDEGQTPDYSAKFSAETPNFFYSRATGVYLHFNSTDNGPASNVRFSEYDADAPGEEATRVE